VAARPHGQRAAKVQRGAALAASRPRETDDGPDWSEWRLALLRFVHRLTGDVALAEDIAQEALLRYLKSPGAVAHPRAWLFRVATNLVRDHARRRATAERPVPVDADAVPRPDEELERKENVGRARAALDRLSERDRAALLMRETGMPYAEIAAALDVRTDTVATIVMRALRRFRKAYGPEDAG
jgi:RNA polymerase sigma-70 factor (ECF subfamily)